MGARTWASSAPPTPMIFQLYCEPMQKIPPRRARARRRRCRPSAPRAHRDLFRSAARSGIRRSRTRPRTRRTFPCTPSRSGRWRCITPGARRTRWLRQIHGANRLYMNRARARQLGIADGDWVWITSAHRPRQGAGEADGRRQPRHGVDLERHRQARRRLGPRADAPEATRGFLLNHLIAELLPEQRRRLPLLQQRSVTGQAAWYDLRVRIEKAAPARERQRPRRGSSRSHAPPGHCEGGGGRTQ